MDRPIDLKNPNLDNVKFEKSANTQSTFIPPERPEYNEWCKFIKKEIEETLYN